MMITYEREKLINALIYFSENVLYPGKTKLFKLLNYLDFLHFEKTGRSVTGLKYYAWDQGPVPKDLYYEWDEPLPDFIVHLAKKRVVFGKITRQELTARKRFDDALFSVFELRLLSQLAKAHFKDNAADIVEKTHFETRPWHEIYEVQGRRSEEIPYDLVLLRRGNESDMEILERAEEYKALKQHYQ